MLRIRPHEDVRAVGVRPAEISEGIELKRKPSTIGLSLLAVSLILNLVFQVVVFVGFVEDRKRKEDAVPALIVHVFLALACLLVLGHRSIPSEFSQLCHVVVDESLALIICTGAGLQMLLREVAGECHTSLPNLTLRDLYCNPLASRSFLAQENIVILAILPLLLDSCLPSMRLPALMGCCLICAAFLVATVVSYDDSNSSLSICLSIVLPTLSLRMRRYHEDQGQQGLKEAASESMHRIRESVAQANAEEWRSMLMNIAHDLKTPLAAFTSGSDVLQQSLQQLETILSPEGSKRAKGELLSAKATVGNMQSIGEVYLAAGHAALTVVASDAPGRYMSMMIHRCIDYTKTSHGIKLVPFVETIDVAESVQGAVACVQDMQPGCSLEVASFPDDMSRLVATDKLWFEENVLCLIANAVKYGLQGPVQVRILLEHLPVEDESSARNSFTVSGSSTPRGPPSESDETSAPKQQQLQLPAGGSGNGSGSGSGSASGGSGRLNPFVRIEVEDQGMGISEEVRKGLFDEQLCHIQRLSGGTGLGLYTLARRCEALGGSCGVRDRTDQQRGSLFWLRVPYVPKTRTPRVPKSPRTPTAVTPSVERAEQRPSRSESSSTLPVAMQWAALAQAHVAINRSVSTTNADHETETLRLPGLHVTRDSHNTSLDLLEAAVEQRTFHILVVDDSQAIVKMTRKLLEKDGHRVDVAYNGLQAVEMWWQARADRPAETPFDAIIMDIQMPVMDGIEATKQIRALEMAARWVEPTFTPTPPSHTPSASTSHKVAPDPSGGNRPLCDSTSLSAKLSLIHPDLDTPPLAQLIIGCSANSDSMTAANAFEAGANAFMPKPMALARIKEIIMNYHDKSDEL